MKIYLASRFSRRLEMKDVRTQLEALGHQVTSRWLYEEIQAVEVTISELPFRYNQRCAENDLEDVSIANAVVSFTEGPDTGTRGDRHIEAGFGLGQGKRMLAVGHRENIFHYLPEVEFFETKDALFHALKTEAGCP